MRGEPNKRHNKKITRPCPVCGGRVTVCYRNDQWWVACENDSSHIPQKLFYRHVYDAITEWNKKSNG